MRQGVQVIGNNVNIRVETDSEVDSIGKLIDLDSVCREALCSIILAMSKMI